MRPIPAWSHPPLFAALAVGLAVGLAAGACGPDRAGAPPTDGPAVVAVPAAATTLLPPLARAALDFELGGALYLGLNYAEWEDGGLSYRMGHRSGLARAWEIEGSRLTYHLDPGRTWSDGEPIRAADVVFTYGLLQDTSLALPLASVTARMDSVTAPDDVTAVFHFAAPYPGMLFDTGVGILPEHVFGRVEREDLAGGMPGGAAETWPVTGPFRLAEWAPPDRVILARNEDAVAPARLERLVVRVIPDETTRAAELRAGSAHAAPFDGFREARTLADRGFDLHRIPQRGYDFIAWNPVAHPALALLPVRQALSLAIDREALIAALDMTGFAEPAWAPYGSLFGSLRPRPPHEPLHDPEAAVRLLEEAGWTDADGDGVREREGERLALELRVPAANRRRADAAEILQRQLGDVGVALTIRTEEFNTLFDRLMAGEYEAALMGWQVALDPDISPFWADPGHPFNVVAFLDPAVSAAIDTALARPDAESAAPYWRRAAAGVAAAYPYAFLWYFDLPFVTAPALTGVEIDAMGWGAGLGEWAWRGGDGF